MKIHPRTIREEEVIQYKKRVHVRTFFQNAVRRGEIKKPNACQLCDSVTELDAHHVDYGRPLDVIWVCHSCHGRVHRKNHPLNPENNTQTPMPSVMDRYKTVTVAFTLPVREYLSLKAQADKQKQPVSKLMKKLVKDKFPVQSSQMEFNFEEKKNDNTHAKQNKRIQSVGEDESVLLEPKCELVPEVRSGRGLRVPRMEQQLFPILTGYGANAPAMQRAHV